ncbi:Hypothetical predicted protein [Mytilus galloprovincialis]|uniref:Ankyrin repeat domain-containing protein 54 n=1 Tax=Mytilus galloprovincialis TaxID=29158 RepID=A0A8B6BYP9_MYTGA|nr:Hypothetical predicted protein [Mytilus galloprovincialis]
MPSDTPQTLVQAASHGNLDIVTEYLELGGDVNYRDQNGHTPLHCAVINETKDIVSELLRSGSDPTVVDKNGRTPLHCAVINETKDIISDLLRSGADPTVEDKNGKTTFDFASSEIQILLLTVIFL